MTNPEAELLRLITNLEVELVTLRLKRPDIAASLDKSRQVERTLAIWRALLMRRRLA